jgi:hypothetical protein
VTASVSQLTRNYFVTGPDEDIADIPRYGDGPRRVRITHILHPFENPHSEHHKATQELTFETMRVAARTALPSVPVRLVCVTLPGEAHVVPPDFIAAPPLSRTVLDMAQFRTPRRLPLLFDILENGLSLSEQPAAIPDCEDYVVLTNADIHLQPHFYLSIVDLISAGYDVMTINRRTIPGCAPRLSELPLMYGETGSDHPGVDCFVFPRQMYAAFVRNNACVGMLNVMRGLVFNLAVNARRYLVLTRARLTFHIGDDRTWDNARYDDYRRFNMEESKKVVCALAGNQAAAENFVAFLCVIGSSQEYIWAAMDAAGIPRTERGRFPRPPKRPFPDRLGNHTTIGRKLLRLSRRSLQTIIFPVWSRLPDTPKRLVRLTLYGRPGPRH